MSFLKTSGGTTYRIYSNGRAELFDSGGGCGGCLMVLVVAGLLVAAIGSTLVSAVRGMLHPLLHPTDSIGTAIVACSMVAVLIDSRARWYRRRQEERTGRSLITEQGGVKTDAGLVR